jgi:hypothetical protein
MADLLFEADDEHIAALELIAHKKGVSLEDYVRELIIAEARKAPADIENERTP